MPVKRRALALKLVLLLVGCLAGLLLAEVGLRVIGFGLGTSSAFQPDPYCGSRHVPNFAGWHTNENRVWIEINEHGFRDRERTVAKPPGTYRIAVIGDSFSEAMQVELDDTYWSILERELNQRGAVPGKRVEVLNFGVSGYGTAQQLAMLRHYVGPYDPDMVLLQFLASNDVRNNSRTLEPDKGRPFYTLAGDELVYDDSFLTHLVRTHFESSRWIQFKHFFIEHSRICALVYQLRHRGERPRSAGEEAGLAMTAFREPQDEAWREAWAVTDRLILEIAGDVQAHGARFVLMAANTGVEVDPNDSVRQPLLERLGVEDLTYPERRLEQLGAAHGFPVLRLAPPMLAEARQSGSYMHGFPASGLGSGHWNENGHRFAGQFVAGWFVESNPWQRADRVDRPDFVE